MPAAGAPSEKTARTWAGDEQARGVDTRMLAGPMVGAQRGLEDHALARLVSGPGQKKQGAAVAKAVELVSVVQQGGHAARIHPPHHLLFGAPGAAAPMRNDHQRGLFTQLVGKKARHGQLHRSMARVELGQGASHPVKTGANLDQTRHIGGRGIAVSLGLCGRRHQQREHRCTGSQTLMKRRHTKSLLQDFMRDAPNSPGYAGRARPMSSCPA
jgi:hypothetical protein